MHIFTKMKKPLSQIIEIPEGVKVKIEDGVVNVKGSEGENKREFNFENLNVEIKEGKITIGNEKATKKEKRMMNTIASHIKNMIQGVQEKFEYKLKITFSHFPISVKVEGKDIEIKNFLGEKIPRKIKISEGVDIKVDKDIITVNSLDKELAGQAAANFETATKIRGRDKRIFQDGIWIINKAGREM